MSDHIQQIENLIQAAAEEFAGADLDADQINLMIDQELENGDFVKVSALAKLMAILEHFV